MWTWWLSLALGATWDEVRAGCPYAEQAFVGRVVQREAMKVDGKIVTEVTFRTRTGFGQVDETETYRFLGGELDGIGAITSHAWSPPDPGRWLIVLRERPMGQPGIFAMKRIRWFGLRKARQRPITACARHD